MKTGLSGAVAVNLPVNGEVDSKRMFLENGSWFRSGGGKVGNGNFLGKNKGKGQAGGAGRGGEAPGGGPGAGGGSRGGGAPARDPPPVSSISSRGAWGRSPTAWRPPGGS